MIRWLRGPHDPLPDAERALPRTSDIPGLVAAGGELTPTRLEEAYRKGIFPWFSDGQPILWWSPDPRMVLLPAEFKLSRSLRKTIRRFLATPGATIRVDGATRRVIESCATVARDGETGTWIVAEMLAAYSAWHALGRVHSFETWIDDDLAGGLYGVAIGRMFFGESMFARSTDASKIALAALVAFCRGHAIETIDCQQKTSHLASFGGREIARADFQRRLQDAIAQSDVGDWSYDLRLWEELGFGAQPAGADPRAFEDRRR
ncbi:MAG TPA: leucyl/phenylalanyl-tRNA--protein transferase [Caldimonas sp.]|nr:leucyl/phenylalanyl-tRNA--protein transferase [Caldimonas sp.]HEX4235280.1 leucyl/phenylalanyl-tRNA--protein transferase [Caldimonas sp.]